MEHNIGYADRVIRILVGSVLVALAYLGIIGPLGYLGLVSIVAGAVGWCPLYWLVGLKTARVKRRR
jgi:hypothetical protein